MMASLREWAMFSVVVALLERELAATRPRQPELLPSSSNATVLLLALLTCVLLAAVEVDPSKLRRLVELLSAALLPCKRN